jgi:hypothetical protein
LKEQYRKYIVSNESNFVHLYLRIALLKEQNRKKEENLISLELQLSDLVFKENKAIEKNDFEEAQQIDFNLKNTRKTIEDTKNIINLNHKEILSLRAQEILLLGAFVQICEGFSKSIQVEKEQTDSQLNILKTEEIIQTKVKLQENVKKRDEVEKLKEELVSDSNVSAEINLGSQKSPD